MTILSLRFLIYTLWFGSLTVCILLEYSTIQDETEDHCPYLHYANSIHHYDVVNSHAIFYACDWFCFCDYVGASPR